MNFHPFLSAFPVVLINLAFFAEIFIIFSKDNSNWRWLSRLLILLSFLFTAAAFFSGYFAAESASQSFVVSPEVIAIHHNWGRALLFLLLPTLIFSYLREDRLVFAWIFRILLVLAWSVTLYTGYLGGDLVFSKGAGVTASRNP